MRNPGQGWRDRGVADSGSNCRFSEGSSEKPLNLQERRRSLKISLGF
jgi:hypothetical protein